jgi:inhibitor of KinA
MTEPYLRLVPMGDQAVLAYLTDERAALDFASLVRGLKEPWLVDVVSSYTSVAVFFDLEQTDYHQVAARLEALGPKSGTIPAATTASLHLVPCCYEFAEDLPRVVDHTGLAAEQVIQLHAATVYTVYAIGFCPGFPYLGYLPAALSGVPRLTTPRQRVDPGSVGLTGRQTGIYTQTRPGGWNLIGRTPLELVNVADNYFPLRAGDRVQFVRIGVSEFKKLSGRRLGEAVERR